MAEKSAGKQMSVNLISAIIAFAVNMGINFFLTPQLKASLGTEAYGFIGLSANFVQYATIVTSALNTMAGRFISVAYHRGEKDKASRFFSSVLVADLVMAGVLLAISAVVVLCLDRILNIPDGLVTTVKITFAITFLTFIVSVITAVFTTAAFVKNRLEINSIRDILSNLIKIAVVVALFVFLEPELYFIALANLARGLFLLVSNVTVKRKILPEVEAKFSKFDWMLVKTLLSSGIWMSLVQLSNVLMNGFDLLICNLMLTSAMMGLLSISKTIPLCITTLTNTLSTVFAPYYTILYSKNKIKELVQEVNLTSKLTGFIMTVPLVGFLVYGLQFYGLWMPDSTPEELRIIQTLSAFVCFSQAIDCHSHSIALLNSVCNKLKVPMFVILGIGVSSIAIVLTGLNVFNLGDNGVYLIAGVSSVLMCLRSLLFVPIYSAKILKQKWTVFYPSVFRGLIMAGVNCILFLFADRLFAMGGLFCGGGWLPFVAKCLVVGIVGYVVSIPIMFSKKEIKSVFGKFLKKAK